MPPKRPPLEGRARESALIIGWLESVRRNTRPYFNGGVDRYKGILICSGLNAKAVGNAPSDLEETDRGGPGLMVCWFE